MGSTLDLLRKLSARNVEYILVEGMAAIAHGASTVTEDDRRTCAQPTSWNV
jgi:phage protein U